jgi:chromosome segregation ATPase
MRPASILLSGLLALLSTAPCAQLKATAMGGGTAITIQGNHNTVSVEVPQVQRLFGEISKRRKGDDFLKGQITRSQSEVDALKRKLAERQVEADSLKRELAERQVEADSQKRVIGELQRQLVEAAQTNVAASRNSSAPTTSFDINLFRQGLKAKLARTEAEIARTKAEIARTEAEIARLDAERTAMQAESIRLILFFDEMRKTLAPSRERSTPAARTAVAGLEKGDIRSTAALLAEREQAPPEQAQRNETATQEAHLETTNVARQQDLCFSTMTSVRYSSPTNTPPVMPLRSATSTTLATCRLRSEIWMEPWMRID